MYRPSLLALAAIGWTACASDMGTIDADTANPAPPDEGDDTADSPDNDDDAEDLDAATWWSLTGQLEVVDGGLALDQTNLSVHLWTGGSAGPAVQCTSAMTLSAAETLPLDAADGPLHAWWAVTFALPTEGACDLSPLDGVEGALAFRLGLGANDDRLAPAAAASDLDFDPNTNGAYGAYLQRESGPLWVFGIASSEAQRANAAVGPLQSPVPTDVYDLRSLHLLPLP